MAAAHVCRRHVDQPAQAPGSSDLAGQLDHPRDARHVDLPRLAQRQIEGDRGRAVNDPLDRADQLLAVLRREAQTGREQVPAHRPHVRRARRRLVVEQRQHRLQALARVLIVRGPDQHDDLLLAPLASLDQPCERVHAEESGRAGQQERAAHIASAAAPTRAGEGQPIAW